VPTARNMVLEGAGTANPALPSEGMLLVIPERSGGARKKFVLVHFGASLITNFCSKHIKFWQPTSVILHPCCTWRFLIRLGSNHSMQGRRPKPEQVVLACPLLLAPLI